MGDTTDEQVLEYLRAGMRPNALKNRYGISVARSKRVAATHGIDLSRPSVGSAPPTDGPTDPPTDGIIDAARKASPAPAASTPPSVGSSVGPTPLLTGLPTRVLPCTECGILTPKAELVNGLCQSCQPPSHVPGTNATTDHCTPSFIKIDQPSFCGSAPLPNTPVKPGTGTIVALVKAEAALARVTAYQMFNDKRYRPFMAEILDAIDAVRAAIKEL